MKKVKGMQLYYTLLQMLYWISIGLTFSFASAYLQDRGTPNGKIGLVLAAAYIFAAILQPVIAAVIDRWEIPLARGAALVYIGAFLPAFLLYGLPLSDTAVMLLMVWIFALLSSLQPVINSLARVLEKLNTPVDFGAARGIASLSFAVVVALTGQVIRAYSPKLLPLTYGAVMAASVLALLLCRHMWSGRLRIRNTDASGFPKFREFPAFALLLLGVICLSSGEGVIGSFSLQILQNVGGDSGSAGLALGICAASETPAMVLYSRIRRKLSAERLMVICGIGWVVKVLLVYLAKSPAGVFGALILQFLSYGIYIPCGIEYVSRILPENYFLKGQSLAVSAYTLGNVVAAGFGGMLLDGIGVTGTLELVVVTVTLGAVLLMASVRAAKHA